MQPSQSNNNPLLPPEDSRHAFWFSKPMLVLLILLWLGINVWSAIVVAHGLDVSQNFSTMPEWSLYFLAGTLQAAVAAAPIYLVAYWHQAGWPIRLTLIPALWFAVALTVFFECSHQILIQAKNSQGNAAENKHRQQMDALRGRANELAATIPLLFEAKSKETLAFAERAAKGQDGTGIARKGPIYTARIAQFDTARVKFGDLAVPLVPLAVNADFRSMLAELDGRLTALGAKVERLESFYQVVDKSPAPESVTGEYAALRGEVNTKLASYAAFNDVNARTLAVAEVFSLPRKIVNGEPIPGSYYMAIAYGLAPFLVSLLLATYLRVHQTGQNIDGESVEELTRKLRDEEKKIPLRERLVALRLKAFGLRVREAALRFGNKATVSTSATKAQPANDESADTEKKVA